MYEADRLVIKKGENIKFIFINETMMHHPIHLHGHFFRVLNGQGSFSPLKHTVNIAPFETVEIEFEANEEKDWIFHCHNLYHMALGMGGIIHYEDKEITSSDKTLVQHKKKHSSEHGNIWFNASKIEGYSNFAHGIIKFMKNDDYIVLQARHNYKKNYDAEMIYEHYTSLFLGLYVGGKFEKNKSSSSLGIIGLEYTLPLLIKADLRINTNGKIRFGLSNEHQLTNRASLGWKLNTDKEYRCTLSYALTKFFYFAGNYDSRDKIGMGLTVKF